MMMVLVQAKDDPAAEAVARAMGPRLLARMLVGDAAPSMELHHMTVLLIWSRFAAASAERFGPLCSHAERLVVLDMDGAPFVAAKLPQAEVFDWRRSGERGLTRHLSTPYARPRAKSGLARMAAGLFAALGAFIPAGAAMAQTHAQTMGLDAQASGPVADLEVTTAAFAPAVPSAEDSQTLVLDLAPTAARPIDDAVFAKYTAEYVAPPLPAQIAAARKSSAFVPGLQL